MFHGDGAQAGFLRQQPLGGQPPALRINPPENIVPQLPIEKQIGGTLVFVDDIAHLVMLLCSCSDTFILPVHIV